MDSHKRPNIGLVLSGLVALTLVLAICVHPAYAAKRKPTSLGFYLYIAVQNDSFLANPAPFTATLSAHPAQIQPFSFGKIHTFDSPLTTAPSLISSLHVGRAQGWYGDVGQHNLTLFLALSFTLSTPNYSGSLSLLGADVASDAVKDVPIVGGTGDFAFARGVATLTLVSVANIDYQTVSWFHYKLRLKYS